MKENLWNLSLLLSSLQPLHWQPLWRTLSQAADAGHKLGRQVMVSLPLLPTHKIYKHFTVSLAHVNSISAYSFPVP